MPVSTATVWRPPPSGGVYRSEEPGGDRVDVSKGLPPRFGFPLAVHPPDGNIIYGPYVENIDDPEGTEQRLGGEPSFGRP